MDDVACVMVVSFIISVFTLFAPGIWTLSLRAPVMCSRLLGVLCTCEVRQPIHVLRQSRRLFERTSHFFREN